MTLHPSLAPRDTDPQLGQIIRLAVMAVGGQGGGVLTGWIETLARAQGYHVQATSVAGVAQRTGATIYYIEMAPASGRAPVFSLAPAAGDVDILIAAEMMEAGRAILRGFVTPDRTTLIASTHRALAVSEKMTPGDGIADPAEVRAAAGIAAQRVLFLDMEALARQNGSVISASLFGALAGSGALPFARGAYEAAIRSGGKGTEASLRAFAAGFAAVGAGEVRDIPTATAVPAAVAPAGLQAQWAGLLTRAQGLPAPVAEMAVPGLRKVVDFQDLKYGDAYLTRLETLLAQDSAEREFRFTREAAKYLANAMAYDDVIRVADLKTRAPRFARIRDEMGAAPQNVMQVTEFMHPRAEEIAGLLPQRLGVWVLGNARAVGLLHRLFRKGRRLRTDGLWAFGQLYVLAGLRRWRRGTLRHHEEMQHLEAWLATATGHLPRRYDLATEVLRCRRLIKGYSDTHARGQSKYDRVLAGIALVQSRGDAVDWARRLREAALRDAEGKTLDGALATIRSFAAGC